MHVPRSWFAELHNRAQAAHEPQSEGRFMFAVENPNELREHVFRDPSGAESVPACERSQLK